MGLSTAISNVSTGNLGSQETVSIAAADVDAEQPSVTFLSFCGIALVEMVKKRFITSGVSAIPGQMLPADTSQHVTVEKVSCPKLGSEGRPRK